MRRKRYVLEGEWSGYHSGQRKIVHRTVTRRPERYANLRFIVYTDNTTLSLRLRECTPREKVQEIHGYDDLIEDCLWHGVNHVADLPSDESMEASYEAK